MTESGFTSGLSPTWLGYESLKHLVVFGASYCDVGYDATNSPHPSKVDPLGVPFPGVTWNEPELPNWVGHIIKRHSPSPEDPLLAYDFGVGGARTAQTCRQQIKKDFPATVGAKPDWAPWKDTDTLFCTFVGLNDCALSTEHSKEMCDLFEAQASLYELGARNFMLIDLPPIDRSPGGFGPFTESSRKSLTLWNRLLREHAQAFKESHPDASVMVFPMWRLFTKVLDTPDKYGFSASDIGRRAGPMWFDHIHPTSKMHGLMADAIVAFLKEQTPLSMS